MVHAAGEDDDSSIEGGELPVQGIKKGIAVMTETRFDDMILRRQRRMGVVTRVSCDDTNGARSFLLR